MNKNESLKLIAGISWRNVWRNKRRSLLTFLTIMAGCAMILLMRSFQNGGYDQMIEDAIAPFTGHVQVHEKGFWKNSTLEYSFRDDISLLGRIRGMPEVKEVSRRIHAGGLLIYGDSSAAAEIIGIEPSREKNIITLQNYILPGGRFINDSDTTAIVLGNNLAKNLGVKPGNRISMVSQGFDGSIAAEYFTVAGIFRSPNIVYNTGLSVITFPQADATFFMSGYVSSYAMRLKETGSSTAVRDRISHLAGDDFEVMAWDELMPEIVQFIVMDRFSSHIFVFILYMIVAFGILNTIQMAVYERIRELGIMLSIGTSPLRVFAMVMTESVFIALIGIAAGLAAGWAISYYFTIYPIDYSEYQAEMELYGVSTLIYYAKMKVSDFINCAAVIMVLTVVFTYFPARKAANLDPVRAIRHL